MNKIWMILMAFVFTSSAWGQTIEAQAPRGKLTAPLHRPKQMHSVMDKDTTPLNCEVYRRHPHPRMVDFCQTMEHVVIRGQAQRQGRPLPSTSVVLLPSLGTSAARDLGYACIGGQAFRKLDNGWEQVITGDGWQRCQEAD